MLHSVKTVGLQAEPLSQADFDTLARSYKASAFRMEMLPQYLVDQLNPRYNAFLSGDPVPPPNKSSEDWVQLIRDAISKGKTMSRVHILPEKLTPYLKYEIEWGYTKNSAAGDDIRIVLPSRCDPTLQKALTQDFWLFDDTVVVLVDYDSQGSFKGLRRLPASDDASIYRDARRLSWERSIPLREFLSLWRQNLIYT